MGIEAHISTAPHGTAWSMAIATHMHSHHMDSIPVDTCIIGSLKLNSIDFLISHIVWSDGKIPSFSIDSF